MSDAELVIFSLRPRSLFSLSASVRFDDGDLIAQIIGYLTEPGLSARRMGPSCER